MGDDAWWTVPLAVLLGIPMYSNAAGIIPVVEALLEKGAALGTVLAFMMAVIALSLPETIILKKVLKWPLIVIFLGVVGARHHVRRLPLQPGARMTPQSSSVDGQLRPVEGPASGLSTPCAQSASRRFFPPSKAGSALAMPVTSLHEGA